MAAGGEEESAHAIEEEGEKGEEQRFGLARVYFLQK